MNQLNTGNTSAGRVAGTLRLLAVLISVALLAVTLAAPRQAAAQAIQPDISNISNNFAAHEDQYVTVRGLLVEVVSSDAFLLADAEATGDRVLVVGADRNLVPFAEGIGYDAAVSANVNMQVHGYVRDFVQGEIEDEIGYELNEGIYEAYGEATPVIVAYDIEVVASLSDVADNTQAYLGLPVTVYGDVVDVLSTAAFQLNDFGTTGFDTLLVLRGSPEAIPANTSLFEPGVYEALDTTISALVRGTVAAAGNPRLIEEEIGYELDPTFFSSYAEDGVILADYVQVIASLSDINDNPAPYLGLTVTVEGDVVERIDASAFELDDEALVGFDTLLVVDGRADRSGILPDDVRVTGTVRSFDLAVIEDEIGYDLDAGLFMDYAGQPVIVATSIVPDND